MDVDNDNDDGHRSMDIYVFGSDELLKVRYQIGRISCKGNIVLMIIKVLEVYYTTAHLHITLPSEKSCPETWPRKCMGEATPFW